MNLACRLQGEWEDALLLTALHRMGRVTEWSPFGWQGLEGATGLSVSHDLYIGTEDDFQEASSLARARTRILLTSGPHPRERASLLTCYAASIHLPPDAWKQPSEQELRRVEDALAAADAIVCKGSLQDAGTYRKYGLPLRKIRAVQGGSPSLAAPAADQTRLDGPVVFAFANPLIDAASGFDILFHLFTDPEVIRRQPELHVVGTPVNAYFRRRIAQLGEFIGDRLHVHGALRPESPEWRDICSRSHVVIAPGIGGGQSPHLMAALVAGTIPWVGAHTGLDYSPFGYLELGYRLANVETMVRVLDQSPEQWSRWKRKTAAYCRNNHGDYVAKWSAAIEDCASGMPYPKLSVTLPIFNKQETIASLLSCLHEALNAYGHAELHVIFDGCKDRTEEVVRSFFASHVPTYSVTYETTPDLFEVKTNNIGLAKSTGRYAVLLQDDNYILDPALLYEAVGFLERNRSCAVLGCLSGVNFYPRGTQLTGPGQLACNENEVYWRQDERTDSALLDRIFETDACMRGPLVLRRSFLEQHGLLDEVYAPLYQDDMDLCFRARSVGSKVYAMLGRVENRSLTMAHYSHEQGRRFEAIMKRNTDIFYSRWTPGTEKDYDWIHRLRP